jgi:hypothetical protein
VTAADLDANGVIDLATANVSSDDVSVLLNQCLIPPVVTTQPQTALVDAGVDVTLSVGAVLGTPPLSYQWRKDGVPLVDGGRVLGSQTDTLTISNANPGDTDVYDVVVSNAEGQVVSDPAVIAVRDACPTDTNADGTTDLQDLLAILAEFGSTCP